MRSRRCNVALDKIEAMIMRVDRDWQWEDDRHTNLPIADRNLVKDKFDYAISQAEFLILKKVYAKDQAGNFQELIPVNPDEPAGREILREEQSSGTPKYYLKIGNSLLLGPKASYDSTNGLRILYERKGKRFTPSSTTEVPGINPLFHELVALYAARDWCKWKGLKQRKTEIDEEIAKMETELVEHYRSRAEDHKTTLRLKKEDYGQRASIYGPGEPSVRWK